jgi:glyoxylase-like metal-dependent hydrolase (beta-lactamase superfamily II)
MEIGQVFDLGGRKLEVIDLKGHTPGSVGLLDREDRILYSGDGLNTHLWMQLDHSLPLRELESTILRLKADFGCAFDHILTGHAKDLRSAELVDQLLKGCREILAGSAREDQPYHYFGGECLQHPITDVPGEVIVYRADNL